MTEPRLDNARLKRAYDLISDKLAKVEEELLLHFRSPIPTIDRIGTYLAQGGGKRIRPALLKRAGNALARGTGVRENFQDELARFFDLLEQDLGKPVISSASAMMWHALRLAGVRQLITGYGRLLTLN